MVLLEGFGHSIQGSALTGGSSDAVSQCLEFAGIELLAVYAAGGTGDGFVHQSPTEIVGAGIQTQRGTARPHFHP